jgi:twinkle protein
MKNWSDFGIDVIDRGSGHVYVKCPVCSPERKKTNLKALGVTCDPTAKSWACNHCGFSGSLFRGILNKGDATRYSKGSMQRSKKDYIKPVFIEPEPKSEYPKVVMEFFTAKKISEATLKKANVSFCRRKFSASDDENKVRGAIMFPYYKNGEVVNIKFRAAGKVYAQSYQAEKTVYGYDNIIGKKDIIITEGEADKLSFEEAGIDFSCSVPDGAPHPGTKEYSSKFDYLIDIEEILDNAEKVILAVDNDEAGEKLKEELGRRIGKDKCFVVTYPEGCKDPNDVLKLHGIDALRKVIGNAVPYPISGVFTLRDVEDEIDHHFKYGITTGYELPWNNMKDIYKVGLGEFTTVTGIPGSGKSELIDSILIFLAKEYGLRIGIFSPEHPMWVHIFRLAEKLVNKPIWINSKDGKVENRPGYMTVDEYLEAKIFINEHFYWIKKERGKKLTIQDLNEKKKSLVRKYGVRIFVDDPYNKMDHARPSHMSETEYISEFLDNYGEFNEDHNTHSFLVAHPTKLKKDKTKIKVAAGIDSKGKEKFVWEDVEKYPVATAYDISGSANWFNKSLNVLSIYRDGMRFGTDAGKDMPTIIFVQKVKFKWNGKLALAKLYFNTKTGNYNEAIESPGLQQPQTSGSANSQEEVPF